MILYCVEIPWNGHLTPDEYIGCYRWFGSKAEAEKDAREQARSLDPDDEVLDLIGDRVEVYRVTLPKLSTKRLVLWMSKWACAPGREVISEFALVTGRRIKAG